MYAQLIRFFQKWRNALIFMSIVAIGIGFGAVYPPRDPLLGRVILPVVRVIRLVVPPARRVTPIPTPRQTNIPGFQVVPQSVATGVPTPTPSLKPQIKTFTVPVKYAASSEGAYDGTFKAQWTTQYTEQCVLVVCRYCSGPSPGTETYGVGINGSKTFTGMPGTDYALSLLCYKGTILNSAMKTVYFSLVPVPSSSIPPAE